MASVLVVDDSWVARLGLTRMLKTLGHEPAEAENGLLALEILEKQSFDFIFLDLLMPGMEGPEVLQTLMDRKNTIPVIVLSADIQETTKKRCFELGAKSFLKKPPQLAELETVIRNCL